MSRSAEGRRPARDEGFALIEIVAALGVLSVVLVALLPQLVVGIRATTTARVASQAKGVAQGQLERMRNLPFHIAPAAGDFVDVLDYYYPDLGAPTTTPPCPTAGDYPKPQVGWTGYVTAGSTARCAYEPSSGAFFRTVEVVPPGPGITGFTMVIDTQFLSGATPPLPVSPASGYDSLTVGRDSPPAAQIGVTVTVLDERRGKLHPVTSRTQIAERLPTTNRVRSEADVRVLDVGSVTVDRVPLSLSAGLVSLSGSVSYASTVDATLTATSAGLATGEQGSGASSTVSTPPASGSTGGVTSAGELAVGGCHYACWGRTSTTGFSTSATNGLPIVGSPTSPAQVQLTDATHDGLSFGDSLTDDYLGRLQLSPPLVRMDPTAAPASSGLSGCGVGGSGSPSYLSGSGYLQATDEDTTSIVESCAVARATPIELFPTSFAPHGVVRIELQRASAHCVVQGAGHTATATYDYSATVQYFNGLTYTTAATVAPGQIDDPLESVLLTTPVGVTPAGLTRTLGDYISSWSTLTSDKVAKTELAGTAQVNLPGLVKISSQPVRPDAAAADGLDASSVVALTVGALSCKAVDAR